MNKSVEKGHDLDDTEAQQVVGALVKQRRDSIEQFHKGGRQDLADKELAEIAILESYLPPAAEPALIDQAVTDAIAETGATSAKDMGKVMKAAMAKLAGQTIDGKVVNELVRKKLGRRLAHGTGSGRGRSARHRDLRTDRPGRRPRRCRHAHQPRPRTRSRAGARGALRRRRPDGRVPRRVSHSQSAPRPVRRRRDERRFRPNLHRAPDDSTARPAPGGSATTC